VEKTAAAMRSVVFIFEQLIVICVFVA